MSKNIRLGCGMLTWGRGERVSDRYGAVYLSQRRIDWQKDPTGNGMEAIGSVKFDASALKANVGQCGKLVAKVVQSRDSQHIGDWFHSVSPSTPDVGEVIVLGEGRLFSEPAMDPGDSPQFGLRPEDGRDTLWLDIHALYRCHEQTVEICFEVK